MISTFACIPLALLRCSLETAGTCVRCVEGHVFELPCNPMGLWRSIWHWSLQHSQIAVFFFTKWTVSVYLPFVSCVTTDHITVLSLLIWLVTVAHYDTEIIVRTLYVVVIAIGRWPVSWACESAMLMRRISWIWSSHWPSFVFLLLWTVSEAQHLLFMRREPFRL